MGKRVFIKHPLNGKKGGLSVRVTIDSRKEEPLDEIEILVVALDNALTQANESRLAYEQEALQKCLELKATIVRLINEKALLLKTCKLMQPAIASLAYAPADQDTHDSYVALNELVAAALKEKLA